MSGPVILWFRQDLRLDDHLALIAACSLGTSVLPVFIEDDSVPRPLGQTSKWWLSHSLKALSHTMRERGARLHVFKGDTAKVLKELALATKAIGVYWSRCYDPEYIGRDSQLKTELKEIGLDAQSFTGQLLFEPWQVENKSGQSFKVFSPFWKACRAIGIARQAQAAPKEINGYNGTLPEMVWAKSDLLTSATHLNTSLNTHWQTGEASALKRLTYFVEKILTGYKDARDMPCIDGTSRLSPHLRWGEISPLRIWHTVQDAVHAGLVPEKDADKFLAELGWREFSFQLLYFNPNLKKDNLQQRFNAFPWVDDTEGFERWRNGQTGYPIVDAGMRELRETGYMHNRVRMIAASFLIKHLMIDWRFGEAWFWDQLVDADPANNTASWQWVAGSGADAAPYFRIFNPIIQGRKFDPDALYTGRFVPELNNLPVKYAFSPWEAPLEVLKTADVDLGVTYPLPIVDHGFARERALAAFSGL